MSPSAFAELLAAWVATTCGASRVDIVATGLDAARLAYAQAAQFEGMPCRGNPTLRAHLAEPSATKSLLFRPRLAVWRSGWVTAQEVRAGQPVAPVAGEVRVDRVVGDPLVGEGPWLARRDLGAGAALTDFNTEPAPDAEPGDTVTVVLGRGDLHVSAQGRLLDGGRRGDAVRVLLATGTVVTGDLAAPQRVEIR